MNKAHMMNEKFLPNNDSEHLHHEVSTFDLKLVTKKIQIKYSPYKISTQVYNMNNAESIAISSRGVLFSAKSFFEKGTLMRVWVEIPDYWPRKAKHVDYRHTNAPTHFQILSRVVNCKEQSNHLNYHVLCENLNIDSIDETILQDYLVSSSGAKHK